MLALYMALIEDEADKIKFENIYYSYRKQMLVAANEVLKNETLAEDAVQNALLGIAKRISNVQDNNPQMLRAYVLTAARNAAINLLKKEKRHEHMCISIHAVDEEVSVDQPENKLEQVKAAISRLPLLYREVLMLHYVQNMNYAQMAELLHRSQSTLRQQVSRGKKMMRQVLEEEGILLEV